MNALLRFFSLGAQDADRRVAAALAPAPFEPADRYLKSSVLFSSVDRVMRWLQDQWLASEACRLLSWVPEFLHEPASSRYRSIAWILLTATVAHVALTLLQGPRQSWFWMIIPAMVAVFAALLLAGSRPSQSAD